MHDAESAPQIPGVIANQLQQFGNLQGTLHPEIAGLHRDALAILADDLGRDLHLKPGSEIVSPTAVNVHDGQAEYRVRLFATREHKEPFEDLVTTTGLRFFAPDENETKVMDLPLDNSTRAFLVGEEEQGDGLPQAVRFVKDTLVIFESTIAEQEHQALVARERRHKSLVRGTRRVGALGGSMVALAAAGVAAEYVPWHQVGKIGGQVAAKIGYLFSNNVTRFDDHHYRLADGDVGTVGQTIHPAFSTQLYNNTDLLVNKVPRVDNVDNGGSSYNHPYDGKLKMTSGLRELIITTDVPGHSCRSASIEHLDIGARVVAWTDFLEANGQSGASELDVSLKGAFGQNQPAKITACWFGHDPINGVHPRVVFKLLP